MKSLCPTSSIMDGDFYQRKLAGSAWYAHNFHPEQRSLGVIKSNQKAKRMPTWLFPNVWIFPCPHMAKRVILNSVGWGQKVKICWSLWRSILQEHPIYRQQRFAGTWREIKTTSDWFNDMPCVVSQESPVKNKNPKKHWSNTWNKHDGGMWGKCNQEWGKRHAL